MDIDKIWVFNKGVFIKDLKYSINDDIFYYNVLTIGGDELVYKYSKEEHLQIVNAKIFQYLKTNTILITNTKVFIFMLIVIIYCQLFQHYI